MNDALSRRELLTGLAAAGGASLLGTGSAVAADPPAAVPAAPAEEAQTLTVYPYEANVWVRVEDRPFTCYRTNPHLKGPYFYPLNGPGTGLSMTEEAGDPWPHHRSVFFGCDQVNKQNFWQQGSDRGQIVSSGPHAVPVGVKSKGADLTKAERVIITDQCDWRVPTKPPIMEDTRSFVIWAPSATLRVLDANITWKALVDVHIGKTNHSLFAVRVAKELTPLAGGRLVNSRGQEGEKATLGEPAKWCGFEGTRLGITESIVLLDHPGNPWAPTCPWFTREYGFMSPTPFDWLEKGWDLAKGKSVRMLYRVAVFTGPIQQERVDALWNAFAEAPDAQKP